MPDAVGRTVYRIVQEGITNARKHAPGALLTVEVTGSPEDGIDVRAAQPARLRPAPAPRAPGWAWSASPSAPSCAAAGSSTAATGSTFVLHGWIPWAA